MRIAIVVFDGMTLLDATGFYDVMYRLNRIEQHRKVSFELCGMKPSIKDEQGVRVEVDKVRPDLSTYDALYIPGGFGTRYLRYDEEFVGWLRIAEKVKFKIAVSTGSLLLGAAGFLKCKRATIDPNHLDLLKPYCSEVLSSHLVKDQEVITAGGISASIDVGLYLVHLLSGDEVLDEVKQLLDYPFEMEEVVEFQ
ncbi:DJ-1/PfpI family protein [Paenibacillus aquistagni]|uniref:Cyclohexyl-isocyanide hydratase n=1 Tax=Paenibacillus aquistagni TaxID=1852522 RepID=A0A1X7ITJ5_9BACL|nr:DJ-1/PfpI family protein [Paenibacillus aquistagni]SMG18194.1 cyclohexyl-isocyanide hydratase [Paenibacillus aquistagni]